MSTGTPIDPVDSGKYQATLTAQLALKGFQVHPLAVGGFFVCKWNLTKYCAALEDVQAFAEQVGAA
ncbi:hypothetical protein [Hydrogenophaga sp. BPS33]|uniref:hypothetical protein n=1 Tax=Hydrogenophaga sp. BPS33 TaxID=2651974 RepID=UPI0013202BA4|nr:hypothetical protein [Hydrogenophaga sp. BPS33]QHE85891.1 hypothetical protein F9K07_13745 [Hydrogenophaga sp. BPS33]